MQAMISLYAILAMKLNVNLGEMIFVMTAQIRWKFAVND
jgi:hypothetical protein